MTQNSSAPRSTVLSRLWRERDKRPVQAAENTASNPT